jgi:ligand-binding sensor domain-containing protein
MAAHSQNLPSTRYTTSDGLVADRVSCAVQDDKGFMWFGTYFGISRYDGYHFTTIQLPPSQQNKYVATITAAEGNVYAGFWFDGGLMEYSNGKTKAFSLPADTKQNANDITAIIPHPKKGILVAGGGNSVFHFTNGKFTFLFDLDSNFTNVGIACLSMDKQGNIWAGTLKGLVVYTTTNKLLRLSEKNTIYLKESEKGMMVVSGSGRHYQYDNIIKTADSFSISKTIWKSDAVIPVLQNSFQNDYFWITDTANRFINITASGKTSISTTEGISKGDIHFFYADRENNLWIATHTGIVKMANLPALSYAFPQKAFGAADITGNDSLFWISNSQSLFTFQNGRLQKIPEFRTGKNRDLIGRVFHDGNYLWSTAWQGGLWRMQVKDDKILSEQFFHRFKNTIIKVHSLVTDGTGNLWAAGENGIFYIRDGEIIDHFQPTTVSGKPMFIVTMVIDTTNTVLWIGENGEGIYKILYTFTPAGISYTIKSTIHTKEGLTDGNIRSLLLDSRNTLWTGTRFAGIFCIREEPGKVNVQNFTSNAGLSCLRVTDIKEDDEQNIWIATCSGIYRYRRDADQWQWFNSANGLMDAEVYAQYVSSHAKKVWALSPSGITVLNYSDNTKLPAPLVNITRITILGKNDTAALFNKGNYEYAADESSIGFQFAGTSYTDEKKVLYKYMLQGHDKSWSAPTRNNNVNYVSLPPGDYVFKVMASSGNDHWSTTPATFSFTIVQPFYKSPWFLFGILCVAFAIFYFFRMYRLNERLKVERIRSRISSDLHDDIGSTLSSISIISEGAIAEKNPLASKQMVREISENTQFLLDKMDDIIWCVNPGNDSFRELLMRIRKFASSLFEAKGIDYDIVIDEGIHNTNMPMNYRQHIYLILKEAINNLVKYSGSSYAAIHITQKGTYLEITITDNGKGFDIHSVEDGNGLRNMKNRAADMGAQLVIDSNTKGTRIFLGTNIK